MGYSISVPFNTVEEKIQMKKFLEENQDLLKSLLDCDSRFSSKTFNIFPLEKEQLGYPPKRKNVLGFNGIGIPEVIWDLCAWMTVKINGLEGSFYYDSQRIKLTTDIKDNQRTIVTQEGLPFRTDKEDLLMLNAKDPRFIKVQEIFLELDNKWNSLKNESKPKIKP